MSGLAFVGDRERYRGQSDLLNIDHLQAPITVVGAGAIGSFLVLSLAKMGCSNIKVYDHDTVEKHNISNQYYRLADTGAHKVHALREIVQEFCGVDIEVHAEKFENQSLDSVVLVSAVDSLKVRHEIFNHLKENNQSVQLFVDGRMGGLVGQVFAVDVANPDSMAKYQEFLFPPEEAEPERCTAKSTMFTVLSISGEMSGTIASYLGRGEDFTLPFERVLDLTNMKVFPTVQGV